MKRIASVVLVLSLLLMLTVQTVLAQGYLELIEARNDASGGVIFVFRFSGEFNKNDFKGGQVFLGDGQFPLNCNITDPVEGILQCTSSRALAGQNVQINLAGQVFWAFVPERRGPMGGGSSAPTCYDVHDALWPEAQGVDAEWLPIGTHCPGGTPSDGDPLEYDGWWYEFWNTISPWYCGVPGNDETGYFELCEG